MVIELYRLAQTGYKDIVTLYIIYYIYINNYDAEVLHLYILQSNQSSLKFFVLFSFPFFKLIFVKGKLTSYCKQGSQWKKNVVKKCEIFVCTLQTSQRNSRGYFCKKLIFRKEGKTMQNSTKSTSAKKLQFCCCNLQHISAKKKHFS